MSLDIGIPWQQYLRAAESRIRAAGWKGICSSCGTPRVTTVGVELIQCQKAGTTRHSSTRTNRDRRTVLVAGFEATLNLLGSRILYCWTSQHLATLRHPGPTGHGKKSWLDSPAHRPGGLP